MQCDSDASVQLTHPKEKKACLCRNIDRKCYSVHHVRDVAFCCTLMNVSALRPPVFSPNLSTFCCIFLSALSIPSCSPSAHPSSKNLFLSNIGHTAIHTLEPPRLPTFGIQADINQPRQLRVLPVHELQRAITLFSNRQ